MNKQIKLSVLGLALILSSLISACGTDVKVTNPADALLAPAGQVQQTVTDFLKDTCEKDAAGNCMTMH